MKISNPMSREHMALFRKLAGLHMLRRFVVFLSEKHGTGWEKGVTHVHQTRYDSSRMRSSTSE
jgi:hypothetical protein